MRLLSSFVDRESRFTWAGDAFGKLLAPPWRNMSTLIRRAVVELAGTGAITSA